MKQRKIGWDSKNTGKMRRARAIFDDAVGRAAAWAEPLTRRRKIQGDEIIVPEGLDTLDGCFLRKLYEIVRCFHGRFVTSY